MGRLNRKLLSSREATLVSGRLEDIAETAVFHASEAAGFYKG